MKKTKTKFIRLIFTFCMLATFCINVASSASTKTKKTEAKATSKYSQKDAVEYEIQTIKKMPSSEAVKSLWRSYLLLCKNSNNVKVLDLYNSCEKKVVSLYKSSIAEKRFFDALRYYDSLQAVEYKKLDSLQFTRERLCRELEKKVPGLSNTVQDKNLKVSDMIKGTVTVFVDKGIKVERGVGYNDGVLGSGFFISKNGYIVTNHHVIADCVDSKYEGFAKLYVKLANDVDTRIPAKIIGYDKGVDLALLKVEVDAPYVFSLGSSSDLDVGDKVYAIGSPLGLESTLTSGIISSKDRELSSFGKVFQIDAAINSGNSGGPLIDEHGRVQAIVFAGVQNYQGLNFAIPVENLKNELAILYNGGQRKHPWTCSFGKTQRTAGINAKNEGVYVHYVMPGGSAQLAGLAVGDVIYSVGDTLITSFDDLINDFLRRVSDTIIRIGVTDEYGNKKTRVVYLEERPESPGYEIYMHDALFQAFLPIVGMGLTPASTSNKKKFVVNKVIKGSVADESGFSEDDLVQVNRVDINKEKTIAGIRISAQRRQNGFLDAVLGINVPLDSPYYF